MLRISDWLFERLQAQSNLMASRWMRLSQLASRVPPSHLLIAVACSHHSCTLPGIVLAHLPVCAHGIAGASNSRSMVPQLDQG
jgi:hypothetical protein